MVLQTFTFSGTVPAPDEDSIGWAAKIADTTSKIQALFDAGTPMFTKDDLQQAYEQLKRSHTKRQRISIKGIDAVKVDFDIVTGSIRPYHRDSDDTEFIVYVLFLDLSLFFSCFVE
jgi:hypothetical protein